MIRLARCWRLSSAACTRRGPERQRRRTSSCASTGSHPVGDATDCTPAFRLEVPSLGHSPSRHRFHSVLMSCLAGSLDCLGQFKRDFLGLEAGRRLRQRPDRPETFNDPPQAEYSSAIGSSLQLRNRPRVETTTRTLGVETTRGVAVAPDVFSFFSPKKEPGAEPRASRVDQASTAETPGRLEYEVF